MERQRPNRQVQRHVQSVEVTQTRPLNDAALDAGKTALTSMAAKAVAVQARPERPSCRIGFVMMEARPCKSHRTAVITQPQTGLQVIHTSALHNQPDQTYKPPHASITRSESPAN